MCVRSDLSTFVASERRVECVAAHAQPGEGEDAAAQNRGGGVCRVIQTKCQARSVLVTPKRYLIPNSKTARDERRGAWSKAWPNNEWYKLCVNPGKGGQWSVVVEKIKKQLHEQFDCQSSYPFVASRPCSIRLPPMRWHLGLQFPKMEVCRPRSVSSYHGQSPAVSLLCLQ